MSLRDVFTWAASLCGPIVPARAMSNIPAERLRRGIHACHQAGAAGERAPGRSPSRPRGPACRPRPGTHAHHHRPGAPSSASGAVAGSGAVARGLRRGTRQDRLGRHLASGCSSAGISASSGPVPALHLNSPLGRLRSLRREGGRRFRLGRRRALFSTADAVGARHHGPRPPGRRRAGAARPPGCLGQATSLAGAARAVSLGGASGAGPPPPPHTARRRPASDSACASVRFGWRLGHHGRRLFHCVCPAPGTAAPGIVAVRARQRHQAGREGRVPATPSPAAWRWSR